MSSSVLSAYGSEGRWVRLHTRLRWHACPLVRVAAHVPPTARTVLDVGCGHGLLSLLLASDDRRVVGVDPDPDKVAVARRAAGRMGANASFDVAPALPLPSGPWDAIAVVDVLYLLDPDMQDDLLRSAAASLAPGGVLICKDMAPTPRWKARWDRVEEWMAVRVLKITQGGGLHVEPPSRRVRVLRAAGLSVQQQRLDRGYPHPHHLIVATPPVSGSTGVAGRSAGEALR